MGFLRFSRWVLPIALFSALAPNLAQAHADFDAYTLTDLGNVGGRGCSAFAINDAGRITGVATRADGVGVPFLWDGLMTALPPLPGFDPQLTLTAGVGLALNDSGEVVGWAYRAATEPGVASVVKRAARWNRGGVEELSGLAYGNQVDSVAQAIDSAGRIAVYVADSSGNETTITAHIWNDGKVTDLGSLGGSRTDPIGMNPSMLVVGGANPPGDQTEHAFVWWHGVMLDLGTRPGFGFQSEATAINSKGVIVGFTREASGLARAFLWHPLVGIVHIGQLAPMLETSALAINDLNEVVGRVTVRGGALPIFHAFLWKHGTITDLNQFLPQGTRGWLSVARGINNRGQIIADLEDGITSHNCVLLSPAR